MPESTAKRDPVPEIDPELRRFMSAIARDAADYPAIDTLPLASARLVLEKIRVRWSAGGPPMASIIESEIPGSAEPVRVRVYQPRQEIAGPALVYLHGGGWTLFSLDTHDRLMREYAERTGYTVIGVDYALAPEHRYPVALNQVISVMTHLGAGKSNWGIDPGRLAIGGDSAGANLAVAACLALRDSGMNGAVQAMLLNYGAFNNQCSDDAVRKFGGPDQMLSADEMDAFWANYVRDENDYSDPLVCPCLAELRGLPPALFVVPECDLLAEQSVALAERMVRAGIDAELRVYRGATHSFLEAVSVARISDRALTDSASWLTGRLA